MSDFLGINKLSDKLPEQYPFHGGRFTLMASWYSDHIKLDPVTRSVLKEIIGYLNFNNFYEPKEIRQKTLIQGTGWCRCTIISSIKELKDKGIISIKKGPNNKNIYRLENKMPEAYELYLKETCPHKFKKQRPEKEKSLDVSERDYDKKGSLQYRLREVYHTDYGRSTTQTTSSLSHPNNHPINFNPENFDKIPSSLGKAPQTPKNEKDDIFCLDKKIKKRILERIVSQKDEKLFITKRKRNIVLSEIAKDFDVELLKRAEKFYIENQFVMIKCNEISIRDHLNSIKTVYQLESRFQPVASEDPDDTKNILPFKTRVKDEIPF